MKLIRYNEPYTTSLSDFDRVFERAFSNFAGLLNNFESASEPTATSTARVNLYESDDAFLARFELPGFDKNEVNVELAEDQLTVTANREEGDGDDKRTVSLQRSIRAPKGIKQKGIKARLENGILNVELPKAEAAKPLAITIK